MLLSVYSLSYGSRNYFHWLGYLPQERDSPTLIIEANMDSDWDKTGFDTSHTFSDR